MHYLLIGFAVEINLGASRRALQDGQLALGDGVADIEVERIRAAGYKARYQPN